MLFTNIINAILRLSYFPTAWKTATVIPLPKPNKNISSPSYYRPISLLSSLSKIAEKIILSMLKGETERHNIIPDAQFGFRNEHSTVNQLKRVADDIMHNNSLGYTTGLILLDSEKAFDSVWTDLLRKE